MTSRLASAIAATLLAGCGLLTAPVRLAGNVVEGTAQVTRAAVTAPGRAIEKRKDRREEKRRRERLVEEQKRLDGTNPRLGGESPTFDDSTRLGADTPEVGGRSSDLGGSTNLGGSTPSFGTSPDEIPLPVE